MQLQVINIIGCYNNCIWDTEHHIKWNRNFLPSVGLSSFLAKTDTKLATTEAKSLKSWVVLHFSTYTKRSPQPLYLPVCEEGGLTKDALSSPSLAYFDWPCTVSWTFSEVSFLDPSFFPAVPRIWSYHLRRKEATEQAEGTSLYHKHKEQPHTRWDLLQVKERQIETNPGWSSTPTKSISTILNIILPYVRTQFEGNGR